MDIRAATELLPEVRWTHGDDLCNCTFQRIGEWTNPYLGRTLRVRFCCIWKELYKQYPEFVQEIPAYWDDNESAFIPTPMDWDSEDAEMPKHLWHRQVAIREGKALEQVRQELRGKTPPQPVARGTGRESKGE